MVYSDCQCSFAFCWCSTYCKMFILFRIALWPSAGKELFLWLFICVVLILVPSCLYVSLSHLVFGAEYGIRLYPLLIIVFISTFYIVCHSICIFGRITPWLNYTFQSLVLLRSFYEMPDFVGVHNKCFLWYFPKPDVMMTY